MTNNDHKSSKGKNEQERNVGGDGFTPLDQLVTPVGPQMTIPFNSVDSKGQQVGSQEHLHVFGQSQLHNNLGPVYAIPTYPEQHGEEGAGQSQGKSGNLALFGQSQFHDNLGPVYAVPTYPWPHGNIQGIGSGQPHGHSQNMVNGQWQQWGIQPHAMAFSPYCCGCYSIGCFYC